MLTRLPLIAAVGAVLLLTACGPVVPTAPTPTDTGAAAPPPTTAPVPSATPAPVASGDSLITAGTCTPAEETATGVSAPIPTVYTVYNTLPTSPVTIHYMAFNSDGTMPIETLSTTGPVINIVGYPCTEAEGSATWTLTATHNITGSIGCALDFGGLIVKTDSDGQEDPHTTINCSGNPGE